MNICIYIVLLGICTQLDISYVSLLFIYYFLFIIFFIYTCTLIYYSLLYSFSFQKGLLKVHDFFIVKPQCTFLANIYSTPVEVHPQKHCLGCVSMALFCWLLFKYSFCSSLASLPPTAVRWHLFFQVELVWMGFEYENCVWDKQEGLKTHCTRQYN